MPTRLAAMAGAVVFLVVASLHGKPLPAAAKAQFHYISLLPKANLKPDESMARGFDGDDLAELPVGEQEFGHRPFKIEQGFIHLSGNTIKNRPISVEGIKVDRRVVRLNILHGTNLGARGEEGDPLWVGDGTLIATYKVHYQDKTTEVIPIIYGKDVRDLWDQDKWQTVTRSIVGWHGANRMSRGSGEKITLYLTSWENKYPHKLVTHVDYISANTPCAPVCAAMTAEGDGLMVPNPEFYHDFRDKNYPNPKFKVMGPNEPGRINSEPQGLRISMPAKRDNNAPLGVGIRFRVKGDCEITTTYHVLETIHPEDGNAVGFELYLMTDTPTREATSYCHLFKADGNSFYAAGRRTTNEKGRRIALPGAQFKQIPAAGRSGQLCLTRIGALLIYSAAEEQGKEFRELYRANLGTEDIIMLRLGSNTSGPNGLELRIQDLRIRTLDPK